FERPRNANEFGLQRIRRRANHGVAMSAHIDEGNVGRQIGIRQLASFRGIAAASVLQAGSNAVLQEQVESLNVQRTQRMVLREGVFPSFEPSRSRNRSSNECQANRLELFRREGYRL